MMFICRKGHESERTPSGVCRQCRSEYMRRYRSTMRLENPEKWKEYMRKKRCSRSYTENKAKYMKRYFERRNAAYVALKELGIEV